MRPENGKAVGVTASGECVSEEISVLVNVIQRWTATKTGTRPAFSVAQDGERAERGLLCQSSVLLGSYKNRGMSSLP